MSPVRYERRPPIAVITLNRPEALNAINRELFQALDAALAHFNEDSSLKAAILTGEGRAFSAGMDLKESLPTDDYGLPPERLGGPHKMLEPFSLKPIVGAVRGYCLAHGIDWAMHCDVLVASEDARFGLPEVRIGLTAGYVWDNLPHIAPAGDGLRLLLSGEPISAREAWRLGLVHKVVRSEALMEEAWRLVESFAAMDSEAAAKIKRVAYFWRNLMLEECCQLGDALTRGLRAGAAKMAGEER